MHFGQWLIEDYKSDKIARQETVEACQQCLKGFLFPANRDDINTYLTVNLRRTIEIRSKVKANINWFFFFFFASHTTYYSLEKLPKTRYEE